MNTANFFKWRETIRKISRNFQKTFKKKLTGY